MNDDNLLKKYEKMIWNLTKYFYGVDKNDLYQAGVVGLYKALKNYNVNTNAKFSTYAYKFIFGEMNLLANNNAIKISKDILRLRHKIEEARYKIAQNTHKMPTNLELAEVLGLSLEDVDIACMSANAIMSLDNLNDDARSAYECIAAPSVDVDTKILIDDSMAVLSEDEKSIIKSRYYEDLTQSEVARKLNMTQVMVSRYEKRSINKMREYLAL